MRRVAVYNAGNIDELKAFYLNAGFNLDIFYWPEFIALEAEKDGGAYEIFVYQEDAGIFIYPYLKRKLPSTFGDYWDIQSPYGYGGPFSTDPVVFHRAERVFLAYCEGENIVSEFVRYHILYNRDRLFTENILNEHNRTVLLLNARKDWEDIWMHDFSSQNRTKVRQMEKEQYAFEITDFGEAMDEFIEMYRSTMDNAGAKDYYYFDRQYFEQMYLTLGQALVFARVIRDGITYGSGLFFRTPEILTYHLGARNLDFPHVRATNLLLSRICSYANQENIGYVNFGGGLTNAEDDSLFRFKMSFTKDCYPFMIGKRIHNPRVYEEVKSQWISLKGEDAFGKVSQILQF
jgi:hypothetical protein